MRTESELRDGLRTEADLPAPSAADPMARVARRALQQRTIRLTSAALAVAVVAAGVVVLRGSGSHETVRTTTRPPTPAASTVAPTTTAPPAPATAVPPTSTPPARAVPAGSEQAPLTSAQVAAARTAWPNARDQIRTYFNWQSGPIGKAYLPIAAGDYPNARQQLGIPLNQPFVVWVVRGEFSDAGASAGPGNTGTTAGPTARGWWFVEPVDRPK